MSPKESYRSVFTILFVEKTKGQQRYQEIVQGILNDPLKYDDISYYPWRGFEKKDGANRIVYGVCGECRAGGFNSEHPECKDYSDETVVFRTIYTVL